MTSQEHALDVLAENIKDLSYLDQYRLDRERLLSIESQSSWDANARSRSSLVERKAQQIILKIRESERVDGALYGNLPGETIPDPRTRDMGGRFLVNKPAIDRSRLFAIARRMPKGAHLHLHFNSEISPEVLFEHARGPGVQDTMFVRTTQPLLNVQAAVETEIVFSVLPANSPHSDCFSDSYNPGLKESTTTPWMLWRDFRARFPGHFASSLHLQSQPIGLDSAECWAREKMIVTLKDAYHDRQTHNGAWACFNQGTRAFKGLVNYESVYRWYIGGMIDSMIRDRVMYAELRPMLLDKTIPSDDGTRQLGHFEQMAIVCEEIEKKRAHLQANGMIHKFPFGLKIIYATPRSIPRARMQTELEDCIRLKLEFPGLICGFDLVGAEDRPNHIGFYADLLLAFTKTCAELNISIPFMFHAGETLLDTGGSSNPENSNLYDSLLLNAKRIGHGYALLKHPVLVEKYKKQNICLELCPISNELLHLCGNAREHPFPQLLAAGLHCTLNADNPSLFRGATLDSYSLSYEFYQVMVGDTRMTIHGWKQLAEWSLEHSCLDGEQKQHALEIFARDFEAFCEWVVKVYGEYAVGLPDVV